MTDQNRLMGSGWRRRQAENERRKAELNSPELLARRAESAARLEAERAEQARLATEAEARRAAELVSFPPMPPKLAAEIMMAFERFRAAGREATLAETEAVSLLSRGMTVPASYPMVRATHGLPSPVSVSGVAPPAETKAVASVVTLPAKPSRPSKGDKPDQMTSDGMFLIETE